MTGTEIAFIVSAVIGAGTAIHGQRQQRKAQESAQAANERARKAQQRQSALEQQLERRKQIRQARAQRARAISSAVEQGAGLQSTVTPGTTGGLSSQLASNLGFLSQSSANIGDVNQALTERSAALSDAATAGATRDLGLTIFNNSQKIGSIFGGSETAGGDNPTA